MIFPSGWLDRIHEGMQVVDAAGHPLGRVVRVQAAAERAPDALSELADVVPSPPDMSEESPLEVVGTSPFGGDPAALADVPDSHREHLGRAGFIEIEGPHLAAEERFIAADRIESVAADQVRLRP